MAMTKTQVYAKLTASMIEMIKDKNLLPWQMPWDSDCLARSGQSGNPYRGINLLLLSFRQMVKGYGSNLWLTINQTNKFGGRVTKDEHGQPVILWKPSKYKDKEGNDKSYMLCRTFFVFNLDQTEGVTLPKRLTPVVHDNTPIERAEAVISQMPNAPEIRVASKAFYVPSEDWVGMPSLDKFHRPEAYYHTAFHELAHSTGHVSRLSRFTPGEKPRMGNGVYSKEELVAEFAATFIGAHCDIDNCTETEQSAAYLRHWVDKIENDPAALINGAQAAQKAADYILGV